MKKVILKTVLLLAAGLVGLTPAAHGERPIWAIKATGFPVRCMERSEFHKCKPLRIPSPDHKSSVEVAYGKDKDIMFAFLRLVSPGRGTREFAAPCSYGDDELLWSPNSKAFFINGGCGSSISGFLVSIYLVDSVNIDAGLDLTHKAMRDMVKSFPPCKALHHDPEECKVMQTDPEYYNMSGIDWLEDSSGIVVMSEVPPSSRYGGIMGQVMGYELEVPSGNILRRLNAVQLKMKWQKSMAWKLYIPDPPEYQ
ncbi:MAG TPA: hypothetical protein VGD64_00515 [Acidisarcina sp.]